ncbi:MAG: hypothetical protein WC547_05215, partial [Candidatus Omnitrophota bacterium]
LESLFSPEAREKEIRRIKGFGGAAYLAKLRLTDGMYENNDLQAKGQAVRAKLEEQVEQISDDDIRAIVAELIEYNGNKWIVKDFGSVSTDAVDLHKDYKELAIFLAEYLNLINRMKAEKAPDGALDITVLVNRKIVTDVETAVNYAERFVEALRTKAQGTDDVVMKAAYQMMFSETDPAWMTVRAIMSLDIDRFVENVASLKKSDIEGWTESLKLLDTEWQSKEEKNKKETIEKFIKILEKLGGFSEDGTLSTIGQALLVGISMKVAFNAKDEMMTLKALTTGQIGHELFMFINLGKQALDIAANKTLSVKARKEIYKNFVLAMFETPRAMTKTDVDNLKDNSILIGKDGGLYSFRNRIIRGGRTMFVVSPLENSDNDESRNSYLAAETVRQDFLRPMSVEEIEARMLKTRIRGESYPETHMIMLDPKTGTITEAQQDAMIKNAVANVNKQIVAEDVKEPARAIVIFVSDLVLKLGLTKSDILERAESLDADIKEVLNANTSREIVIVPTPDKEMVAMAKANGRELNAGKIQFNANDFLATGKKVLSEGKYAYVGFVTAADLFTPQGAGDEMVRKIWTFVFGEGENVSDESGTFVVSTNRVHPQFYGREFDRGSFVAAVVTETLHELGHALGFAHCHNQDCLMGFSSTYDSLLGRSVTGKIGDAYCSECRAHLAGIKGMGSFASTEEARTIAAERRTRREALLKTITTNGLVTVTLEWARDLEKKYGVSIDRESVDADNYTMIAYEKDANLPWRVGVVHGDRTNENDLLLSGSLSKDVIEEMTRGVDISKHDNTQGILDGFDSLERHIQDASACNYCLVITHNEEANIKGIDQDDVDEGYLDKRKRVELEQKGAYNAAKALAKKAKASGESFKMLDVTILDTKNGRAVDSMGKGSVMYTDYPDAARKFKLDPSKAARLNAISRDHGYAQAKLAKQNGLKLNSTSQPSGVFSDAETMFAVFVQEGIDVPVIDIGISVGNMHSKNEIASVQDIADNAKLLEFLDLNSGVGLQAGSTNGAAAPVTSAQPLAVTENSQNDGGNGKDAEDATEKNTYRKTAMSAAVGFAPFMHVSVLSGLHGGLAPPSVATMLIIASAGILGYILFRKHIRKLRVGSVVFLKLIVKRVVDTATSSYQVIKNNTFELIARLARARINVEDQTSQIVADHEAFLTKPSRSSTVAGGATRAGKLLAAIYSAADHIFAFGSGPLASPVRADGGAWSTAVYLQNGGGSWLTSLLGRALRSIISLYSTMKQRFSQLAASNTAANRSSDFTSLMRELAKYIPAMGAPRPGTSSQRNPIGSTLSSMFATLAAVISRSTGSTGSSTHKTEDILPSAGTTYRGRFVDFLRTALNIGAELYSTNRGWWGRSRSKASRIQQGRPVSAQQSEGSANRGWWEILNWLGADRAALINRTGLKPSQLKDGWAAVATAVVDMMRAVYQELQIPPGELTPLAYAVLIKIGGVLWSTLQQVRQWFLSISWFSTMSQRFLQLVARITALSTRSGSTSSILTPVMFTRATGELNPGSLLQRLSVRVSQIQSIMHTAAGTFRYTGSAASSTHSAVYSTGWMAALVERAKARLGALVAIVLKVIKVGSRAVSFIAAPVKAGFRMLAEEAKQYSSVNSRAAGIAMADGGIYSRKNPADYRLEHFSSAGWDKFRLISAGGEEIGFASVYEVRRYNGVSIDQFGVEPRNQGLGTIFYGKIEEYYRKNNIEFIFVHDDQASKRDFWPKRGLKPSLKEFDLEKSIMPAMADGGRKHADKSAQLEQELKQRIIDLVTNKYGFTPTLPRYFFKSDFAKRYIHDPKILEIFNQLQEQGVIDMNITLPLYAYQVYADRRITYENPAGSAGLLEDSPALVVSEFAMKLTRYWGRSDDKRSKIKTYVLNTCVAVIMYDPRTMITALAHLNGFSDAESTTENMIRQFQAFGVDLGEVRVFVIGTGHAREDLKENIRVALAQTPMRAAGNVIEDYSDEFMQRSMFTNKDGEKYLDEYRNIIFDSKTGTYGDIAEQVIEQDYTEFASNRRSLLLRSNYRREQGITELLPIKPDYDTRGLRPKQIEGDRDGGDIVVLGQNISEKWRQRVKNSELKTALGQKDPQGNITYLELGVVEICGEPMFYGLRKDTQGTIIEQLSGKMEETPLDNGFVIQLNTYRGLRPGVNDPKPVGPLSDLKPHDPATCPFGCQDAAKAGSLRDLVNHNPLGEFRINGTLWRAYKQLAPLDARGHFLLVPDVFVNEQIREQKVIAKDLEDVIALARDSENVLILFNSRRAGASVNHIHFQGVYRPEQFPVERAQAEVIRTVGSVTISRLVNYSASGLVFTSQD